MKLLQINNTEWINPELITVIYDEGDYCFIEFPYSKVKHVCDMPAQQLMSKICEEVYYGDNGICKEDKWWNQESKD